MQWSNLRNYNFCNPFLFIPFSLSLLIGIDLLSSFPERERKEKNRLTFSSSSMILCFGWILRPPPSSSTMYGAPPPPHYAMLESGGNQYYGNGAAYHHRNAPQYYPYRKKSGAGSCCRCICCCCCFILLLILIHIFIIFYLYHVYDPKVPTYKVEGINVKAFDINPDSSLNTEFQVTIRAENPNKNIGFIYGSDNWVSVDYSDANLCAGKLPSFQQGHENTTIIEVDLKGKSEFGSGLQRAFAENQNSHRIPLLVKLEVPVGVVLGEVPLKEFKVFVNCSMVMDSLSPNKTARIISKETTFSIADMMFINLHWN